MPCSRHRLCGQQERAGKWGTGPLTQLSREEMRLDMESGRPSESYKILSTAPGPCSKSVPDSSSLTSGSAQQESQSVKLS